MERKTPKRSGQGTTFIVEVKYCQHATWQGTITWVENNKKENFRSALEMLKLMDTAIGKDFPSSGDESWGDEN